MTMLERRDGVLSGVRAIAPLVREQAAAVEAGRRLTEPVLTAMRRAGVFRMAMSRSMGGPELTLTEQIQVLEELAAADGSAGWCGMIGSDGGYMSAFLDPAVSRAMYPDLDMATAAVIRPAGRAHVEQGGYRVEGRWPFASGAPHADWFFLNCVVVEEGNVRLLATGAPETRMVAVPPEQVTIVDTWHTSGLAGTASNDVDVNTSVPAERTFALVKAVDPAPLYRWYAALLVKASGVPLGIARAAIDEAITVAGSKVAMPARTLVRDDRDVQDAVGRAQALVGSARAYVLHSAAQLWDEACRGDDPTLETRTNVRLSMTNAMTSCRTAVTVLYEALGTTAVYRSSPLNRQLRDLTTMAQHAMWQSRTYAAAGRQTMGLDPAMIGF